MGIKGVRYSLIILHTESRNSCTPVSLSAITSNNSTTRIMSWNGWIERGLNDFAQYSDNVYTSTPTSTGPSGNPRAPLYYEYELSYIQAQGGLKEEDGFGNYQRCYDKTKGAPYLHGWRSRPGNIHDIEDRRIYLPVGPFRPGQPAPFEW